MREPFPAAQAGESILLDPPRQGPLAAVIAALGRRGSHKVLHIHCAFEQIPFSIKQWQHCGYHAIRVVHLVMFPGSANLDVLILFTKAGFNRQSGCLSELKIWAEEAAC